MCNGNCNQGRNCDCVKEEDRKKQAWVDAAVIFVMYLAAISPIFLFYIFGTD
jgi:hypothetical protein